MKEQEKAAEAAAPQQSELTDERIEKIWDDLPLTTAHTIVDIRLEFARAIESEVKAAQAAPSAPTRPVRQQPKVVQSFAIEDGNLVMGDVDLSALKDGTYWLCTAPIFYADSAPVPTEAPALAEVRRQAFEEAAEICENNVSQCCATAEHCAEDIRALATKEAAPTEKVPTCPRDLLPSVQHSDDLRLKAASRAQAEVPSQQGDAQ